MSVLIFTNKRDTHARVIYYCLNAQGVPATRLFGNEFPVRARSSILIDEVATDEVDISFTLTEDGSAINLGAAECVWFRRPGRPTLSNSIHADDIDIADRESVHYYQNMIALLADKKEIFWVNPPNKKRLADNKLLQLRYAKSAGFNIPVTLASNDPEDVKDFSRYSASGDLMFKSFAPVSWQDGNTMMYCTRVPLQSLGSENIVSAPGIWQVPIPKLFEIRATFFGRHCHAVRIDSQSTEQGRDDWRRARGAYEIFPIELRDDIRECCVRLMERLGIVFGCFDFIVTPDGDFVFLEVNESGQFLWVEEMRPDIPMLDTFVNFLKEKDREYVYVENPGRLRLAEIYESSDYQELVVQDYNDSI